MVDNKYKIFFVEDEPGIADLYCMSFSKNGFLIENFANGTDAKKKLQEYRKDVSARPDVIILDILLPDVSGMELLREVRSFRDFDSIPVIMLTNYGTDEIKKEIKKTQGVRHILKIDTSPRLFIKQVKEALGIKTDPEETKNVSPVVQ
ncbi:MAG: response regulator [Patescibacteria group bacterium]